MSNDDAVCRRVARTAAKIVNAVNPVPILLQTLALILNCTCLNRAHVDIVAVEGRNPAHTRKRRAAYFSRLCGVRNRLHSEHLSCVQGVFGIDAKGMHLVTGFALLFLLVPVLSGESGSFRSSFTR